MLNRPQGARAHWWLALLFTTLFTPLLGAQPYSFINYTDNIIYQPGGKGMSQFFSVLRELESGTRRKVNVVHIGDSHVQADFFPGRVRDLLQGTPAFGNGGRGFVFPYSAAQTNNPFNYSVSYTGRWEGFRSVKRDIYSRWGLAGISAVTRDPNATLTINPNRGDSTRYAITRVKIFYPVFDVNSFNVLVVANPSELVSSYMSREGYVQYEFSRPQSQITIKLSRSSFAQNQFVLQGIALENDAPGVVYSTVGVNGAEVNTYFRCEDFDKHLRVLKPDLVVVSLGTNEAHVVNFDSELYKTNCRFMVSQIRKAAPQASVLFTTPGDAYFRVRRLNPNNARAREKLYELTDEMDISLWDFYNVMGGLRSVDRWYANGMASSDRLHLTNKGYTFQGELLYEALMNTYRSFRDFKK